MWICYLYKSSNSCYITITVNIFLCTYLSARFRCYALEESSCLFPALHELHQSVSTINRVYVREKLKCSSLPGKTLRLSDGSGFESLWGNWMFSIYLILPAPLYHGVYSASNRNECHKQKKKVSGGNRVRPARKAHNLTAICEPIVYTMWYSTSL
jgi:hypothetical protein